jgi:hypothetical protein
MAKAKIWIYTYQAYDEGESREWSLSRFLAIGAR